MLIFKPRDTKLFVSDIKGTAREKTTFCSRVKSNSAQRGINAETTERTRALGSAVLPRTRQGLETRTKRARAKTETENRGTSKVRRYVEADGLEFRTQMEESRAKEDEKAQANASA